MTQCGCCSVGSVGGVAFFSEASRSLNDSALISSASCVFDRRFLAFVLPAIYARLVGFLFRIEAAEHAVQIFGVLEILADDRGGVGVRHHVLVEPAIVLQHVVNDPAQKRNIGAGANRHVLLAHRGRPREMRIDVDELAPRSRAFMGKRKPTGCASAIFEPMIRMQSAFCRSSWKLVAAPRPNEAPRPGTEALCQIRAWFSMGTMPRPPSNSFLMR